MLRHGLIAVTLGALLIAVGALAAMAEDAHGIAPTGSLRVAVAVGPAASAFWATRDPASGKPRGVTVELAKAAADRLHVPLQLVEYSSSDDIAAAGSTDTWDMSFMPAEARREQFVDQGPAYVARKRSQSPFPTPRGCFMLAAQGGLVWTRSPPRSKSPTPSGATVSG